MGAGIGGDITGRWVEPKGWVCLARASAAYGFWIEERGSVGLFGTGALGEKRNTLQRHKARRKKWMASVPGWHLGLFCRDGVMARFGRVWHCLARGRRGGCEGECRRNDPRWGWVGRWEISSHLRTPFVFSPYSNIDLTNFNKKIPGNCCGQEVVSGPSVAGIAGMVACRAAAICLASSIAAAWHW